MTVDGEQEHQVISRCISKQTRLQFVVDVCPLVRANAIDATLLGKFLKYEISRLLLVLNPLAPIPVVLIFLPWFAARVKHPWYLFVLEQLEFLY